MEDIVIGELRFFTVPLVVLWQSPLKVYSEDGPDFALYGWRYLVNLSVEIAPILSQVSVFLEVRLRQVHTEVNILVSL